MFPLLHSHTYCITTFFSLSLGFFYPSMFSHPLLHFFGLSLSLSPSLSLSLNVFFLSFLLLSLKLSWIFSLSLSLTLYKHGTIFYIFLYLCFLSYTLIHIVLRHFSLSLGFFYPSMFSLPLLHFRKLFLSLSQRFLSIFSLTLS